MTRKHWITIKEIKELYNVSNNRIAQMRNLNLVTTKFAETTGKGRKPLLYKKSMVNSLKDFKPNELIYIANAVKNAGECGIDLSKPGMVESVIESIITMMNEESNNPDFNIPNDIEAVVEQECKDKYEYTYVQTVDHPTHYNKTGLEVINAIEAWDLDFSEGNVIKYLIRAKHKKNAKEDLEKTLWYVQRLLENC